MSGNGNARREALALALAKGQDVRAACAEAKVAERTARLWREDPAFTERVKQLQAELFAEAVAVLAAGNRKAADRLVKLVDSDNEKVSLAAARSVLEVGTSLREKLELAPRLEDHDDRLAALEGKHNDQGGTEPEAGDAGGEAEAARAVEGGGGPGEGGNPEGGGPGPGPDPPGAAGASGEGIPGTGPV
jgi:hypothetical protein